MASNKTPEEGELVLATVTNIQYHSIFCRLDEYGVSGMMHISEIAPGRIKNVRDYVREGKSLVLKVLRIKPDKGHIDLSLRRVTEAQRREKASKLKQEQIVAKILEKAAEELKAKPEAVDKLLEPVLKEYTSLYAGFQAVVEEPDVTLEGLGVDKKHAEKLEAIVKDRIKPREVTIQGSFTLASFAPDGIDQVHSAFKQVPKGADTYYQGGGRYAVSVTAPDYKEAEKTLKEAVDTVTQVIEANGVVRFERTDR